MSELYIYLALTRFLAITNCLFHRGCYAYSNGMKFIQYLVGDMYELLYFL
jgi:hypothetical protein